MKNTILSFALFSSLLCSPMSFAETSQSDASILAVEEEVQQTHEEENSSKEEGAVSKLKALIYKHKILVGVGAVAFIGLSYSLIKMNGLKKEIADLKARPAGVDDAQLAALKARPDIAADKFVALQGKARRLDLIQDALETRGDNFSPSKANRQVKRSKEYANANSAFVTAVENAFKVKVIL